MEIPEKEIFKVFMEKGALLKGHFLLSSGLHSDTYLQCALVLQFPSLAERLSRYLGDLFRGEKIEVVIGPALGGIILAYEVARVLGVRGIFAERVGENFTLRRGFSIKERERVLVVEDVITTGGSLKEVIKLVHDYKGVVIGIGCLVDRSGGKADLGVPKKALLTLNIKNFHPEDCPLCKKGIPLEKPGSRYLTAQK